jgi:hypothetical protein
LLGALYLVGLPAAFGTTTTIQFLTSGIGLMAFILYLPGGMTEVMHRFGDLVTVGVVRLRARWGGGAPSGVADLGDMPDARMPSSPDATPVAEATT